MKKKTMKQIIRQFLVESSRRRPGSKEERLIRRIEGHTEAIVADVMALSMHTKNRIAAHKAHLTMAKRKVER